MRSNRPLTRLQLLVLFGGALIATASAVSEPVSRTTIEVFTTADQRPDDLNLLSVNAQVNIRVHLIDGIRWLEADLSRDLPADARGAAREVLRRLQALDEDRKDRVKASAEALLRAIALGVDRYPAIVFDGKFVAYGTTDLEDALGAYRDNGGRTP